MNRVLSLLSRVAAVLILLVFVGLVYLLGVAPLIAVYNGSITSLEEAKVLLQRYERLAEGKADLTEKLEEIRKRHTSEGSYLVKKTDALAAADLQDRVKALVDRSGGTIRRVQTLAGEEEGAFRRITLRLQIMTTIEPLLSILHGLETDHPLLFLDNVDVQGRAAPRGKQGETTEPTLMVAFDLYGYREPSDQ